MADEELEQHAFSVLSRELGLVAYARFLRLFCSGKGDYTAERHLWQTGITIDDIERELNIKSPQETPSLRRPRSSKGTNRQDAVQPRQRTPKR